MQADLNAADAYGLATGALRRIRAFIEAYDDNADTMPEDVVEDTRVVVLDTLSTLEDGSP